MAKEPPYLVEIRRMQAEEDSRQAYDDLYSTGSLSQFKSFYLWFRDRIGLPRQGKLLDVSCGAGELVGLVREQGLQVVGIDISQVVATAARRNLGREGRVLVGDAERLPFQDASFDVVTNIGSLEHFVDPAQGVREMARVLRPAGRAAVLLPNTYGLMTTVWDAFRKGVTAADNQPIQRYGSRADWQRLLENNGLTVCRTYKYDRACPRSLADARYLLGRPKDLVRMFAGPFVPFNLAACFVFICRPSRAGG